MTIFSVIRANYATNSTWQDNIDDFDAALTLYNRYCAIGFWGYWSAIILRNNITGEDVAIMEYEDPYDSLDADEFDALVDCDDEEDANEEMKIDFRKKWNVHAESHTDIWEFWFAEWDDAKRCYETLKANNRTISGCITSGETGELFADFAWIEDNCGKSYHEWACKGYNQWF